jgi:hypothetical protein
MTGAWNRALDAIEIHLSATQAALAAGTPPRGQAPALPSEALPPELADRARDLLALSRDLEAAADEQLDRLRAALRGLPGRRTPARRPNRGSFIDVGA